MPVFKRKLSRHLLAKSHRYKWAFLASFESYNSLHFVHADEVRTANYHTYKEYFNRPPLWKRSICLVQSCPYCSTAPAKLPVKVVRQTMTGFNGSISEEITGEDYDVRTKLIGSLSKDVFEGRTSTRSEPFSLFICLDANKFVLLSFFSLMRRIYPRVSNKPLPNNAKGPLPVDVRRSTTLLRKLPITHEFTPSVCEFSYQQNNIVAANV